MKTAKTKTEMAAMCAACGMRNSYKCKGWHRDPAGSHDAHCGKEPAPAKKTIKVFTPTGELVDVPKTPIYSAFELAKETHQPILVEYKGLNDEEASRRVTFVLAPVTVKADCFRVYTQIDGKHPWGFRVFNPERVVGDPMPAEETKEVLEVKEFLTRVHLV
jgi:hypothetical protein